MAVTFGYSTLGTSQFPCSTDRAYGNRFTLSASGTLATGRVGFESASAGGGNAKLLVYTNASGVPGTLVAASNGVAITGPGWHDFTFAAESITAADYFLICVTDSGAFSNYFAQTTPSTAGDAVMNNGGTSYASPPSTWPGTDATYDQMLSIEVTVDDVAPGAMVGSAALALVPAGTLGSTTMVGAATLALTGSATISNLTPPTTENFGDETLYTDSLPGANGRALGKQFVLTEDAIIKSISVGFTAASVAGANVKGLIFTDVANAPATLVAQGASTAIPAGGGFVETLANDESLTAGTYWIFGVTNDASSFVEHAHNTFGTGSGEEAYMVNGGMTFASPPTTCPAADARYDYDVSVFATYEPVPPAGAIVGDTSLTVTSSGALTASGELAGSSSASLSAGAALNATGTLVGAVTLAVAPSAVISASASISGAAMLTLTVTGTGTAPPVSEIVGSASLSLAATAALSGAGNLSGASLLTAALSGALSGSGFILGSATIVLTNSGGLTSDATMGGITAMALSNEGALTATGQLVGVVDLSLTSSATSGALHPIGGTIALQLSSTASAGVIVSASGAATMSLNVAASGSLLGLMDGAALISVAMVAELLGRAALIGSANLTFSGQATPVGGELPLDASIIVSFSSDQNASVVAAPSLTDSAVTTSGADVGSASEAVSGLGVDVVYVGL